MGGAPLFQGRTDGAKRNSIDRTAKKKRGSWNMPPGAHVSRERKIGQSGKFGKNDGITISTRYDHMLGPPPLDQGPSQSGKTHWQYNFSHQESRGCSLSPCSESPRYALPPACQCGWRCQDPKHVIVFCPNRAFDPSAKRLEHGSTRKCC